MTPFLIHLMQGFWGVHPGLQHAFGCFEIFLTLHFFAQDFLPQQDFDRLELADFERFLHSFEHGDFERLGYFGHFEQLREPKQDDFDFDRLHLVLTQVPCESLSLHLLPMARC